MFPTDPVALAKVLTALANFTPPGVDVYGNGPANPALDAAIQATAGDPAAESRRRRGSKSAKELVAGYGHELAHLVAGFHPG